MSVENYAYDLALHDMYKQIIKHLYQPDIMNRTPNNLTHDIKASAK